MGWEKGEISDALQAIRTQILILLHTIALHSLIFPPASISTFFHLQTLSFNKSAIHAFSFSYTLDYMSGKVVDFPGMPFIAFSPS